MKHIYFLLSLTLMCRPAYAALDPVKLPTAADGEITFEIDTDTHLPVSAEDKMAAVTKAALTFLPKQPGEPLQFTWAYELHFKSKAPVSSVVVEDERDSALKTLITDSTPKIQSSVWVGQEQPREVSKRFVEAMYSDDPWVLIRRISVVFGDGSSSKLHQMVVITRPMRMALIDKTMQELGK